MSALPTVFFDLDGTLMDTAPDLVGAVNELRIERGLEAMPLSQLAPMCSFGGRGMLGKGLGLTPNDPSYADTYEEFIAHYKKRLTLHSKPFPGMYELLANIKNRGGQWGVVTNKALELAAPIVDYFDFNPAPICTISASEVGVLKPDPACLKLACQRSQVPPNNCIYIGDSKRDIDAGNAIGMITMTAGFGYIPADDDHTTWPAQYFSNSVAELETHILSVLPTLAQLPA